MNFNVFVLKQKRYGTRFWVDWQYSHPTIFDCELVYEKKGLLNSFDDIYFVTLVIDYLKKIKEQPNKENVKKIIDYILENINIGKVDLLTKKSKMY